MKKLNKTLELTQIKKEFKTIRMWFNKNIKDILPSWKHFINYVNRFEKQGICTDEAYTRARNMNNTHCVFINEMLANQERYNYLKKRINKLKFQVSWA